jgi:hypothetical protein
MLEILVPFVKTRKKFAQIKQRLPGAKGMEPKSQTRTLVGIGHPDRKETAIIRQLNEYPTGVTSPLIPDNGQLLTVLGM